MAPSDQTSTVKSRMKKSDLIDQLMQLSLENAQRLTVKQLKYLIKKYA